MAHKRYTTELTGIKPYQPRFPFSTTAQQGQRFCCGLSTENTVEYSQQKKDENHD